MEKDISWKHGTFLYPVVRIYTAKAAGSGTIIYCEKDSKNTDDYLTFVLTNHHVVADCIEYKKSWDSVLKKDIEKEVLDTPRVEIFEYVHQSTVDSSNAFRAEIVAYSKEHDLAVLRLESPRKFAHVAKTIPQDKIKDLRLFQEIVVSGCSMGHEPFCNYGQLTFLKEIIEQKKYVMVNAGSYFGNSGGALFLAETGELIGVPSRLTGIQLGFGVDMVTFMGFSCHPERIYEFFDEQELKFLYDAKDDYHKALKRRKRKQKDALLELKAEIVKEAAK